MNNEPLGATEIHIKLGRIRSHEEGNLGKEGKVLGKLNANWAKFPLLVTFKKIKFLVMSLFACSELL